MGFFMNGGFEIMFCIVFFLILIVFVFSVGSVFLRWNKNNRAPVLTVDAKVVSRHTDVRRRGANHDMPVHMNTRYFVTFEFESGDRLELETDRYAFGLIAEQDVGKLTFQGTRFLRFDRV